MIGTSNVVLVCGGREYDNYSYVAGALDALHTAYPIRAIVQGGALGADRLAVRWAEANNVPCQWYLADWERHGKAAGPIRNRQMLDEGQPDIVLAFPGGPGTANMVRQATAAGVPIINLATKGALR